MTIVKASEFIGQQHVQTPSSGNCQAHSVVQALVNSSFTGFPSQLAQATAVLKRGGATLAQIDFESKKQHAARKNALGQLGRVYEKMGRQASEQAFRQYLIDYGNSPPAVADVLPANQWGSNGTLATFSTMMYKDIIVLSQDPKQNQWGALHYEPETRQVKCNNRIFVFTTCGERVLSAARCIETIAELKRGAGADTARLPLVLHFQGMHYMVYVHGHWEHPSTRDYGSEETKEDGDADMSGEESDYEDDKMIGNRHEQEPNQICQTGTEDEDMGTPK